MTRRTGLPPTSPRQSRVPPLGVALVAAAVALLPGCSEDSPAAPTADRSAAAGSPSPSSASPPSAGPEPSPAAVTEAEAEAAAAKINLTQEDLPGFTRSPAPPIDADSDRVFQEFVSCLGGAAPIYDLPSDTFESGSSGYSSTVAVFADADAVRTDLAALARDTAIDCVGTYVQALQGTSGEVTVQRLPATAPGTDGAFGFSVSGGELTTIQVLGFGTGQSEVALTAFGEVSAEQRDALFAALVERAKEHAP